MSKGRVLNKVKLNILFDVAPCKHPDDISCICSPDHKVPPTWRQFLNDQRGVRQMQGVLSERSVTELSDPDRDRYFLFCFGLSAIGSQIVNTDKGKK